MVLNKQLRFSFLCILNVILLLPGIAAAQEQNKARVMILGVYHFHNPNLDMIKTDYPDHLSEKKQREIAEVLDLPAVFKPANLCI